MHKKFIMVRGALVRVTGKTVAELKANIAAIRAANR